MTSRSLLQIALTALNHITNARNIPGIPGAEKPFDEDFSSYQVAGAIDKHLVGKGDAYSTETKKLVVVGHLWCGEKGSHTYDISLHTPVPADLVAAKRIAGDFESLESATLVTTVREIEETVTRTPLT